MFVDISITIVVSTRRKQIKYLRSGIRIIVLHLSAWAKAGHSTGTKGVSLSQPQSMAFYCRQRACAAKVHLQGLRLRKSRERLLQICKNAKLKSQIVLIGHWFKWREKKVFPCFETLYYPLFLFSFPFTILIKGFWIKMIIRR